MEKEKIDRINQLASLAKERELTAEEAAERDALRKEYISGFRENMRELLDSVVIQEPDGTQRKLKKKE